VLLRFGGIRRQSGVGHDCCRGYQQPSQEHLVDSAAKPQHPVDLDNGNAITIPLDKLGIGVDINQDRVKSMAPEHGFGIVAQMASGACV
jgi:hypothetical protein